MVMRRGRRVLALFVGFEDTNAWAFFDSGDGWKKFREDQEDAHTNMAIYAAHAKATGSFVDYDEEPAGFVRLLTVF